MEGQANTMTVGHVTIAGTPWLGEVRIPQQAVAPEPRGWLITHGAGGYYWSPACWVKAEHAVRFARKEDAEAVAATLPWAFSAPLYATEYPLT
jgi:hypothetical protein